MKYPIRSIALVLIFLQPLFGQGAGDLNPAGLTGHTRTWHLPEGAIARLGKGSIADGNHAVDFSSDGRYLAVASHIGVWVYDVATNRYVTLLPTETQPTSVSFSPVGATLAAGLHNHTIALWNVNTGRRIGTLRHEPLYFPTVVFSPDGITLASGSNDGTVQLWKMATRSVVAVLDGHTSGIEGLVFSPDGTMLASSGDNNIKLWDVSARKEVATLSGHRDRVEALAFSPDGTTLASGAWDGTARMWDVAAREQIATFLVHVTSASSVAFSPDGNTLTTGSVKLMIHWDVATRDRISTQDTHRHWIQSLKYSPADPDLLVSTAYDGAILRNVKSGNLVKLNDFQDFRSMAISPDGATVVAGTGTGTMVGWDLSDAEELSETERYAGVVYSLAYSPDGNTLATSGDGSITFWNVATGFEIADLNNKMLGNVYSMAFSRDGSILASGHSGADHQNRIRLVDAVNLREVTSLGGHDERVNTVAFSPDGATLASGSFDRTVRLWDVPKQKNIATLRLLNSVEFVMFSADGNTLVTVEQDEDIVRLWDWRRGVESGALEGHDRAVAAVALSPEPNILASGSFDSTVRLWDLNAQEEIVSLTHHGGVRSLAFSFYKPILTSRGSDGTILVWDMSPYITPLKPDPDFDDNGRVDFADFVKFAQEFGFSHGDAGYDARFDLDGDGEVGFSDYLILARAFGG
ncbi:MAG: hypothetical protein OYM47_08455 [Gemmatimonadota bacterium]|nr:hypothetical protein [Gemmatimonadota bacterium]